MKAGRILRFSMAVAISVLIAALPLAGVFGRTIYVDDSAAGANDGSSWLNAYNYLQDALADANSSGEPVEIRVAEGKYQPDKDSLHPSGTGDREATFRLISGVALRGGYAGFGRPDPNTRDVDKYETVLSGDLLGNDSNVSDAWDFAWDPNRSENCFHVVTAVGTNAGTVLDGFVVTAGKASGEDDVHWDGGGMFNEDSSIELIDCTFLRSDAYDGGAMLNSNSSLNLVNCTFQEHCSWGPGAAISNYGSSLSLAGCVFVGNFCGQAGGTGAGIHSSESVLTLDGCTFIDNFAYDGGGGVFNFESEVTVRNSVFRDNWV
ncbi:MAG: right-handed parallel beta-helix repeat-containing protein, partial [Phycisphaerales bacterium]